MAEEKRRAWWEEVPDRVGGDVISAQIGDNATGVAVGKNVTQTVHNILGEATPKDQEVIAEQFKAVNTALEQARVKIEKSTAEMAAFQVKLLEGELSKTDEEEKPSANTITQVGDWLLDNVPDIAEALTGLFATPAVGRIVGRAGQAAVSWVKGRFGKAPHKGDPK